MESRRDATMTPLTSTDGAHRPEDAGCLERLNRFASSNRLREMRFSGRNINRVIRAAVGPERARAFLAGYRRGSGFGPYYSHEAEWELASDLRSGAFDHPECWGRNRAPLVLVAHPYHLGRERSEQLRQLEALGLELVVTREGWYGFGTYHIRLAVPGALPPPTDGERFATEMALDG